LTLKRFQDHTLLTEIFPEVSAESFILMAEDSVLYCEEVLKFGDSHMAGRGWVVLIGRIDDHHRQLRYRSAADEMRDLGRTITTNPPVEPSPTVDLL
jgi:hypothetical protein